MTTDPRPLYTALHALARELDVVGREKERLEREARLGITAPGSTSSGWIIGIGRRLMTQLMEEA